MRSVWQGVEANHLSQERLVVYGKEKLSWGGGGGKKKTQFRVEKIFDLKQRRPAISNNCSRKHYSPSISSEF